MPYTIGEIDGKHVRVKYPKKHYKPLPQLQGIF